MGLISTPEFLYELTPKDLTGGRIDLFSVYLRVDANAVSLQQVIGPIAGDKLWVVHTFTATLGAGAAQTALRVRATEENPPGIEVGRFVDIRFAALVGLESSTTLGRLAYVVRPAHQVRVEATFDAGAAANTLRGSIQGFIIPRGNIQLVG